MKANRAVVLPVLAGTLLAVGAAMLVCAVTGALYGDGTVLAFALPGAVATLAGLTGLRRRPAPGPTPLRARDGYVAVTSAWLLAAAVGAVPFLAAGTYGSPGDAFFESMSGFTTAGATLLPDVEAEPEAVLVWRSLSQFLGGVGIVLLVVAIAPATGLASQRLFFAEATTPTAERLTPRIADTAQIILGVYLTLAAVGVVALLIAGMGAFDAVNHALTTTATGGFSTRSESIGAFDSLAIELVLIGLMVAAGINLTFYWRAIRGSSLRVQVVEVRAYLLIIAGATTVVTASLLVSGDVDGLWAALRAGAFSVVSLITTTAFITDDFDDFNDFAAVTIVSLAVIGGCAGSTSGGLKVVRLLLLARAGLQELQRQIQPQAQQVLRLGGRVFAEPVRRTLLGFGLLYGIVLATGIVAMLAAGMDVVSAFSAATAALTLGGTGLGDIGAVENFTAVPPGGRLVLCFLMLAGRLEVFTVVALLTPAFWRRQWA